MITDKEVYNDLISPPFPSLKEEAEKIGLPVSDIRKWFGQRGMREMWQDRRNAMREAKGLPPLERELPLQDCLGRRIE